MGDYINVLNNLKRDQAHYWPNETFNKSPHKPFLILSVIDLVTSNIIKNRIVRPSDILVETYKYYWSKCSKLKGNGNIYLPFWHLDKKQGFWKLIFNKGVKGTDLKRPSSLKQLRTKIIGAELNDTFFNDILKKSKRKEIREILVTSYFSSEFRTTLY